MMIRWLPLLCAGVLYAQETIDARTLLSLFRSHHAMAQNFELEHERQEALKSLQRSGAPYALFGSLAQAQPTVGSQEIEYSVGISKRFILPGEQARIERSSDLEAQIALMRGEHALMVYMYDLLALYHQSCLQREKVTLLEQLKQQMEELEGKNKRAYALGEVSKKDHLLWQLQQRKTTLEFERQERYRQALFRKFQGYFGERLKIAELACTDLYPLELPQQQSAPQTLLEYRIEALEAERSKGLGEVASVREAEWSLSYEKELDMERYRVGVNLPLEFTSSGAKQQAQLHRIEALQHEHNLQTLSMQTRKARQAAYIALDDAYRRYETLEGPMSQEAIALFEVTQSAYGSGEASAVEVIGISQQVIDILMQIHASKEAFYEALFDYYRLNITGKEFE
ncbi:MAG: hypothetical protein JXK05_06115 [Campylobacterales bacterium]|nr:hypothetical protein [Campylobacterales bacterium]